MRSIYRYLTIIVVLAITIPSVNAQENKRDQLEKKRKALKAEINQINSMLSSNKKKKQSVLTKAGDLNRRIQATKKLIRTTNQEANLLRKKINENQNKISQLREELKKLKEDYAKMIRRSYKTRSKQSRIMFLFSSNNFLQAYKRLQYMKQYADYRQEQGEKIKAHAQELQELNAELSKQRAEKKELLAQNRATAKKLEADKKAQEALIAKISKKGSKYKSRIQQKQKEVSRIDAKIQQLIREAIAKENAKEGSKSKSAFKLTPEAKALAASFESNKGKLPWPVNSGSVAMRFGDHPSPIAKKVTVHSNGIRIETNEGEAVNAVFKGKILRIQAIRGANKILLIQHGNYISVYRNLKKIYVKTGEHVKTGQKLGVVGKSRDTHRPTLNFYIFKDSKYIDPMQWIIRR